MLFLFQNCYVRPVSVNILSKPRSREFGAKRSKNGKSEKLHPNFHRKTLPKIYAVKTFSRLLGFQTIYALLLCDRNVVPIFHRKMSKNSVFRNPKNFRVFSPSFLKSTKIVSKILKFWNFSRWLRHGVVPFLRLTWTSVFVSHVGSSQHMWFVCRLCHSLAVSQFYSFYE